MTRQLTSIPNRGHPITVTRSSAFAAEWIVIRNDALKPARRSIVLLFPTFQSAPTRCKLSSIRADDPRYAARVPSGGWDFVFQPTTIDIRWVSESAGSYIGPCVATRIVDAGFLAADRTGHAGVDAA